MATKIMIKGEPLSQWEKWLRNELKPPTAAALKNPVIRHVAEGFLELIEKVKPRGGRS